MKGFIRYNKLSIAIIIFIINFFIVHTLKPAMLYEDDGSFRQFGIGYQHKTIIPIWLFSIIIAIFSYLSVMYYLAYA